MARKRRQPVKPVAPQPESSEEENEESSEDGSQESELSQPAIQKKSAPSQQATPTPPPPQQTSSEEDGSGSESESEPDEPVSNVRTPAPKPPEEGQKSGYGGRKTRSKLDQEPITPAAAKRPADDTVGKDSKKRKTDVAETSEKKTPLFQRVWNEEDEIVLLQGMLDYSNKKNVDPIADLQAFYEFIWEKLHVDFTKVQLQDKIRRLKKKFKNNKGKERKGKERTFSKAHEQSAYDLSKMIWGNETGAPSGTAVGMTPNMKATLPVIDEVKNGGDGGEWKRIPRTGFASLEATMLLTGRGLFESEQGIEGETEWHNLRKEEMVLYLKQLEVRAVQAKLVLDLMEREDT